MDMKPATAVQRRLIVEIEQEVKKRKARNRKNYNQYFTPEFVVEKALSLVPKLDVKNLIDPVVGEGIFLRVASKFFRDADMFGMDIDDSVIWRLKKNPLPNARYFTTDALSDEMWKIGEVKEVLAEGGYDLVVGNPPFSSWFERVESARLLSGYELAYRNNKLMKSQSVEALFLERFIKLAKNGGYIVIVLPDGILSNPQYKYARKFLLEKTKVRHILSLPRGVFEETSAKTSILVLERRGGGELNYKSRLSSLEKTGDVNNTILVEASDLIERMDWQYYRNLKRNRVNELIKRGVKFVPLKEFVVYCKTGKTLYGKERKFADKGLRFLHATNITEVGINYKKDEKFIDPLGKMNFLSAHTKVGDMVFVRVGVGCAGRVAIIDSKDDEGIASDYIHILRVKEINPYFLVLYLKTKYGRDSINLLKHGVGTVSINKTDLMSIPIPVVPTAFQEDVEEKFKAILNEYKTAGDNRKVLTKIKFLVFSVEKKIMNFNKEVANAQKRSSQGEAIRRPGGLGRD
ncbi:MAG: class I SAM-dependent DNA methyltransferase [Myxococcota bacterium]